MSGAKLELRGYIFGMESANRSLILNRKIGIEFVSGNRKIRRMELSNLPQQLWSIHFSRLI